MKAVGKCQRELCLAMNVFGVRGAYLMQHFLPYIIRPVGSNRREKQCLQLYVLEDEITMHANSSRSGGFAIKVTGAGEVV